MGLMLQIMWEQKDFLAKTAPGRTRNELVWHEPTVDRVQFPKKELEAHVAPISKLISSLLDFFKD